jgi:protein involved in polysaccharide export with SLBB domain
MMHLGKMFALTMLGGLLGLVCVGGLTGCATGGGKSTTSPPTTSVPKFQIGDAISVTLSDIPGTQAPLKFDDKVREDGTVTLHYGQSFKAEGKTALELQREIEKYFVPDYYKKITVSVASGDQYYTVTGFVKAPSQYRYIGPTTVSKAIATAGYIQDFGSKNVVVIRANGVREKKVNLDRIMESKDPDPAIYPGDTVHVPRRGQFW